MAPAAMMAPWPGISRGLEDMVPTVPGLVSEMVVPWKSAGVSLPRAGARHQVVEGGEVFLEVERAGVLDVGHHQAARAVLAGDIHGDAEVDLRPHHAERLAVLFGVGVVEAGTSSRALTMAQPIRCV